MKQQENSTYWSREVIRDYLPRNLDEVEKKIALLWQIKTSDLGMCQRGV